MTESEIPASLHPEDQDPLIYRQTRRRVWGFISVFVITVLTLLTGYRYAIDTRLNDWYLFQVAKHTTFFLSLAGHSAMLEERFVMDLPKKEVRASLAAWAAGRQSATPEEVKAAEDTPLTPWEQWSYRAQNNRRSGMSSVNGPRVSFVFRSGLHTEIEELTTQISTLEQDTKLTQEARKSQIAGLKERLDDNRRMQQEIRRGQRPESDDKSRFFTFIVVSECGAIEVMVIFLGAVLAFPALWWQRLLGIIGGIPIMYGVNIFRLSCLGVIGALDTEKVWFNFAHEYVWQAVYIVFVVAVWLFWVEYIVKRKSE